MRYVALAVDYDGTIARDGRVDEATLAALERVRDSGRRLLLVTGRRLDDLRAHFDRLDLFDRVVAENGALLYRPASDEQEVLGEPPPQELVAALHARGVTPLSVGASVVATWSPHESAVLEAIHELGLEREIVFNKGAVMVLPPGVNKASGVMAALRELRLSPHNVAGIGDAENDHAFLALCECSAAVANALPAVKERADVVTRGDHGAGVEEFIEQLLATDLAELAWRSPRHQTMLGRRDDGSEYTVPSQGVNILFTGSSGAGKSTAAQGLLERLRDRGYQFLVIDPEGDYQQFEGTVCLGDRRSEPRPDEVLQLIEAPEQNVVANLLGVGLADRPAWFAGILPRINELRTATGRPHWVVVDETHHLMPTEWAPAPMMLAKEMRGMIYITVHPDLVSPQVLGDVDILVTVGRRPGAVIAGFCKTIGEAAPDAPQDDLPSGRALVWNRRTGELAELEVAPPRQELRRHDRKYAEGDLGPERSFYFRGPRGELNLRAQNLMLFLQIGEGVDEETWLHHLRSGDYSRWFREAVKDPGLADAVEGLEQSGAPAEELRRAVRALVEERYTLPADAPTGWISPEDGHQTVAG
jgi:HAD superfamily hydrolase (TIGR01484 family)